MNTNRNCALFPGDGPPVVAAARLRRAPARGLDSIWSLRTAGAGDAVPREVCRWSNGHGAPPPLRANLASLPDSMDGRLGGELFYGIR